MLIFWKVGLYNLEVYTFNELLALNQARTESKLVKYTVCDSVIKYYDDKYQ